MRLCIMVGSRAVVENINPPMKKDMMVEVAKFRSRIKSRWKKGFFAVRL
jgi:hypothetical protein